MNSYHLVSFGIRAASIAASTASPIALVTLWSRSSVACWSSIAAWMVEWPRRRIVSLIVPPEFVTNVPRCGADRGSAGPTGRLSSCRVHSQGQTARRSCLLAGHTSRAVA
jgi:hypothetical protein